MYVNARLIPMESRWKADPVAWCSHFPKEETTANLEEGDVQSVTDMMEHRDALEPLPGARRTSNTS